MSVLNHFRLSPEGAQEIRNLTQELKAGSADLEGRQLPSDWVEQNKKTAQKNWQKQQTAELATSVGI